jgi:hypothetical protein
MPTCFRAQIWLKQQFSLKNVKRKKEREIERQRETERDRERQRETERDRERQRERERERERERDNTFSDITSLTVNLNLSLFYLF